MSVEELKEKAKKYFEDEGISKALIQTYYELRHYSTWDKNQPNKDWNIGVENIEEEKIDLIKDSKKRHSDWLMSGVIENIQFKIGGYNYSTFYDIEDYISSYAVVRFYLANRLVIEATYENLRVDLYDVDYYTQYRLKSVEEFHNQPEIKILLSKINSLIAEKDRRNSEKAQKNKEEREKEEGKKFTF
jgi:hypothetical protein